MAAFVDLSVIFLSADFLEENARMAGFQKYLLLSHSDRQHESFSLIVYDYR